jgi:hypothetical protein
MQYMDNDSSARLKHDIGEFIAGSLPKDTMWLGGASGGAFPRNKSVADAL